MDEAPFLLEPGQLDLTALRELGKSRRKLALDPKFPPPSTPRRGGAVDPRPRPSRLWHQHRLRQPRPIPAFPTTRWPSCSAASSSRTRPAPAAALADEVVRLILILKINALARGFSGIRRSVIEACSSC